MRLVILYAVAIFMATGGCDAQINKLPNARYLGMGYDVIKGNPDNNFYDPGFLYAIFEFKWDQQHTTSDGRYRIPDNVQALQMKSCGYQTFIEQITGSSSFQKAMSSDVSTEIDINLEKNKQGSKEVGNVLWDVRFTGSTAYKDVKYGIRVSHFVYINARAKCVEYEVAMNYLQTSMRVTDDFKHAVENLPAVDDNSTTIEKYGKFISTYGTHFTSRVTLGSKMLIRSAFRQADWAKLNSDGNIGAAIELSFVKATRLGMTEEDPDDKTKRRNFESRRISRSASYRGSHPPTNGKWETWAQSTGDSPAPIIYKLVPITKVISSLFFAMPASDLDARLRLLNMAYGRYCDSIPGCEVPMLDAQPPSTFDVSANFIRSPSLLSCSPKSSLLSCGIKNLENTSSTGCDDNHYAIPVSAKQCECSYKNGAICIAWCSVVDMDFTIETSNESGGDITVSCDTGYKVLQQ